MCAERVKTSTVKIPLSTKDKLTLSIQRRSSQITIGDVNGCREITEVPEGVHISLCAGRVDRCFSQLPLVPLLDHNRTNTKGRKEGGRKEGRHQQTAFLKHPVKSGALMSTLGVCGGNRS